MIQVHQEISNRKKWFKYIYNLREFISGSMSGLAQILIGQPFDTIKVRLQTSKQQLTTLSCMQDLIKQEGIVALYKGVKLPIIMNMFIISLQFGVFENSKRIFAQLQNVDQNKIPKIYSLYASITTGVVCSILLSPMDYEATMDIFEQKYKKYALNLGPILCGGLAGLLSWVFSYPVDTIKSRIQGDDFTYPQFRGFIHCYKKTVAKYGYRKLFKGLSVCAMRSIPANSGGFYIYEKTLHDIEMNCKNKF